MAAAKGVRKAANRMLQSVDIMDLADGSVGKTVDRLIERIYGDLTNRPHDGDKRILSIEVTFKYSKDGSRIVISPKVNMKTPPFRCPDTIGKMDDAAGGIMFNADCPENPDQLTMNEEAEK